ncbi:hypothetical protein G6F31_014393 [Rhizopus arrhizus]|nr:hypothetical protein G6F31_014393 [Rhizopus arrhizus]
MFPGVRTAGRGPPHQWPPTRAGDEERGPRQPGVVPAGGARGAGRRRAPPDTLQALGVRARGGHYRKPRPGGVCCFWRLPARSHDRWPWQPRSHGPNIGFLPSCGDPDETASCPAATEPAGRPAQRCRCPWPGSPRHGGHGPRLRAGTDRGRWHRGVRQAQRGRQPEGLHRAVRTQPAYP